MTRMRMGFRRWFEISVGMSLLLGGTPGVLAVERRLDQLPGDVAGILFVWTEPLKQVVEESRRFDPMTGLWLGLVDGSVKSIERSAQFFLFEEDDGSPSPKEPGKILRYSF